MRRELESAIAAACRALFNADVAVELTRPSEQFGDYATNVALQLAGKLGKNPREIGEQLVAKLKEDLGGKLADVTIAGAGFINLHLNDDVLVALVQQAPDKTLTGKSIVM